jgi:hypothetical protein
VKLVRRCNVILDDFDIFRAMIPNVISCIGEHRLCVVAGHERYARKRFRQPYGRVSVTASHIEYANWPARGYHFADTSELDFPQIIVERRRLRRLVRSRPLLPILSYALSVVQRPSPNYELTRGAAAQITARRASHDQLAVDDGIYFEPIRLAEIDLDRTERFVPF